MTGAAPGEPEPAVADLAAAVAAGDAVHAVGGRTHWEVGGRPRPGVEVQATAGIVAYEPADLTVAVRAGTTVAELDGALAEQDQQCPLDPRAPSATVGGVLAAGLSGPRRLRYGPLRDAVLEVRFVTADGRFVRGGGPTVKNVTGYDLPRLMVGSLGTLGVFTHVTLRCRPQPPVATWAVCEEDPDALRRRLHAPSAILWDGIRTSVLLEGREEEVSTQLDAAGLRATAGAPTWPDGPHRGRISVRPGRVVATGAALDGVEGLSWLAEAGVGTIHVAAVTSHALAGARAIATEADGWLLIESGGEGLDPFGTPISGVEVMRRLKRAFDPTGKLAPGRLPW